MNGESSYVINDPQFEYEIKEIMINSNEKSEPHRWPKNIKPSYTTDEAYSI